MSKACPVGLESEEERAEARAYVEARVDKLESGCWVWRGYKLHAGHGQAKWDGYPIKAHRLSYAAHVGEPGELCVLHECDNPPCCNPAHHFLGTKGDNNTDAKMKGRYALRAKRDPNSYPRGEDHPSSKFTEEFWDRAAAMRAEGLSFDKIGAALGTSGAGVRQVLRGLSWTHRAERRT